MFLYAILYHLLFFFGVGGNERGRDKFISKNNVFIGMMSCICKSHNNKSIFNDYRSISKRICKRKKKYIKHEKRFNAYGNIFFRICAEIPIAFKNGSFRLISGNLGIRSDFLLRLLSNAEKKYCFVVIEMIIVRVKDAMMR